MGGFLHSLFLLLVLNSCTFRWEKQSNNAPSNEQSLFSWIKTQIIDPKCLSCHGAGAAFDFSSYAKIIASNTVVPFKPSDSTFYVDLTTGRMPRGGQRLSDADIQKVFEWIEKGATEFDEKGPEPPPPPPLPQAKYSWIHENIFLPKCVQCHRPPNPRGDTDLSSYESMMASEGLTMKPIEPGSPEQSGLYEQVYLGKMPPQTSKLSDGEIQAIGDWILQGANKN